MFETSFPQLSRKPFFFRQHAPVPFRRRPSLRITGYGNFLSRLCSLSLSARMSPDDALVNICSFYIYWFREHSLACPSHRCEGSSPSFDCALLWWWLPHSYLAGRGSLSPVLGNPEFLLLRLRKKADSDTYLRLWKMAYNTCVTDHYSVEQVAASW